MGVGDSLEAGYTLKGPIKAGPWHLTGDGLVVGDGAMQAEVRFEVVWRQAGAPDGGTAGEHPVVAWTHRFQRAKPTGFAATPFAAGATGVAASAKSGDLLVLRMTTTAGDPGALWIPNGDGASAGGAIPHLDLPR